MLIRFIGPKTRVRVWGHYVFSQAPGDVVQEVDAESAAGMLGHPGDEFEIDADEPLLAVVGQMRGQPLARARVWLLAQAGVGDVEALAELSAAGVRDVASVVGRSAGAVEDLRRVAVEWLVTEGRWTEQMAAPLRLRGDDGAE